MYADAQKAQGPQTSEEAKGASKPDDANVVDAEFTEVKDKKG
jgi:molecular chaperone DnaK